MTPLMQSVRTGRRDRRLRLWSVIAACVAVGVMAGALVTPNFFSNAATTAVSTIYKTATNTTNGSVAASSEAPGGAKAGTAKPGDTLKWVVDYQNNTNAKASVNLKDVITNAGTYVPGSLQLPPNSNAANPLSPQYTTDSGSNWIVGTPPPSANGVGFTGTLVPQGSQQLSLNFPSPAATTVATSAGDAYNVVVRGNLTYGVFHHSSGAVVFCVQQNGATCPGWPTGALNQTWSATAGAAIGTGTPFAGTTAFQNGTWISGNKLFWLVGLSDNSSAGTACLDLSTTTPTSCGYTVLGVNILSNALGGGIGSSGVIAANGKIYGAVTANGWHVLLCIDPATGASCGITNIISGVTANNAGVTASTFGSNIFVNVKQTNTSAFQMYCFSTVTGTCAGSWPVTSSTSAAAIGSPPAPILSSTGVVTGVCTITNGAGSSSQCWNLNGTPLANNPYANTGANFSASGSAAGDSYFQGTKVYVSNGNRVMCRDFATYSGTGTVPACAGFANVSNGINYTARPVSSIAPNCMVAVGDGHQITFFNALTGGGCTGVSGPQTMTVTPTSYYCGSGSAGFRGWGTFSLPGLVGGTYTNSAITLRDQNSNVISGFNGITLAAGGTLNLSGIPTSVTSITATVTVNGVNDPTGVVNGQISITWVGDPPQMCFQTTAPPVACDAAAPLTLSNTANAVTQGSGGSDAPGGNTTAPVQFTDKAAASQCSLAIAKTSPVQKVRPGDKVSYSISVKNTGTQAYNSASFTDDLTDVLKEATYNGDHTATTGTASYTAPTVSWTGALPAGVTATIAYTVTVKSPDTGDHTLVNTVVSPTPGNNCPPGSPDPACTVTVQVNVSDVIWHKTDATAAKNILTGAEWTFTPVDGQGKPAGAPITVTDCVAASAASCTGADIDPLGGSFRLTNLGPGTYQLAETKAPVGFKLNPTPVTVTIAAATTTLALADVVNKQLPVPTIPFTGGLGTDTLTVTGASLLLLMLGLAVWHTVRRERRNA